MQELLSLALRISVMYIYALVILRLTGKRAVGNAVGGAGSLTALDFLVGLIIGDLFDDIFWTEVPLIQGVVALTTIIAIHTLMAYFSYKSRRFNNWISSQPTLVIDHGQLVRLGLAKERTREGIIFSEMRLKNEAREDLPDIRQGQWEPSGQLSLLKTDTGHTLQKKDLPQLKEKQP